LNEQTIDFQPMLLREGSQGGDCIGFFHVSTIIEMT
jgi:hypothetical protein